MPTRTARGLNRVPSYAPPQPEESRPERERKRRRKVKYKMFSLGQGMDMPLFVFVMVLLAIGLVMLFSASYAYCYYYFGNSYYYITRQAIFAIFGIAAMLAISTFDYHRFHKMALPILGVSVLFLCLVLLFKALGVESIAPPQGEAYRWLQFGPIGFQPSEIAKFALIVMFAHMVSQNSERMGTFRYGVLPFAVVLIALAGLIVLENHLSATLIVLMLGAILMFVGGTKLRWLLLGGGSGLAAILAATLLKGGYQAGRISVWLSPFEGDPDATHQIRQSLYAIGSGGLLGVGLGQSRQKYLYLPEPQNDFIFAIVCEELGLVGAAVVIILFGLLIWRGMYIALNAKDKFGMMLGLGITFQVGLQAVLNICVVTNTIPNTGISLPFFSYGGTALLMLLGEMGILLNISRSSNVEKT